MPELSRYILQDVEMPLIEVVADMEDAGYPVDVDFFRALRERLEPDRAEILARLRAIAGPDFNPASPQQVGALLYDRLGLPKVRRTPKGQLATDKVALEQMDHEAARLLLRYRALAKVIDTYCQIPESVDRDGRLHVEFNQLGAETGRFTSASVIQTLPKHDEYGIRNGFRAQPGTRIVAADFDQQELRILAAVSRDTKLLEAVRANVDLHGLAAVKVFNLDCEANEVARSFPAERDRVKAIQFGLIYGRSPTSLASSLKIPLDEAKELQASYFAQFPAVRAFIEAVHEQVVRCGYITDVFGRRRQLPDARLNRPRKHYNQMTRSEKSVVQKINGAKRQAQNFVIQGAAATITKLAMLRCHQHLKAEHPAIKMIVQVHDELHFEVPDDQVEHFVGELPELMCDVGLERFEFDVPMSVKVKVGPSWGELRAREDDYVTSTNATAAA